jgi:hypothetical protein
LRLTRGEDRPNDFGLLLDDLRFTRTTGARVAATGVRSIADNPAVSHHPGYSPLDRLRFILARPLTDEIFDADEKRADKVDGVNFVPVAESISQKPFHLSTRED